MRLPNRTNVVELVKAITMWLGLGITLGWYYSLSLTDHSGWPVPLPEAAVALILYHFSAQDLGTAMQVIQWLAVFPIAGILWVTTLTVTAPFFGGRRVEYSWTVLRFSATCSPLLLPLPLLMYLAGRGEYGGFSFHHMIAVVLRRTTIMPWPWLTPLYMVMAVAALIWQILVYLKVFDIAGKKAWVHFIVCAILLFILACGVSTLIAIPLHSWFPSAPPIFRNTPAPEMYT